MSASLFWIIVFYTLSLPPLLILTVIRLASERRRRRALQSKFGGLVDVEREAQRLVDAGRAEIRKSQATLAATEANIADLQLSYKDKRAAYDRLVAQIAVFDDTLAFAEMGLYAPHFDFDDSDTYKANIDTIRSAQKQMLTLKTAATSKTQWHVDGSAAKGTVMMERSVRLTLRAFNGECDAAIANVRWNNASAMEKRVVNARDQIDKLNASNTVTISDMYLGLKLRELRLTHEYREKLKQEREERAETARAQREEQKLQRDLDAAQDEEERYAKLLSKAQLEAATASGARLNAFAEQIKLLERDLAEAHAKTERAQALAERTRSGHVYVISNVGSFGPDIVKIGLTRRLDPTDRIRELGDASVPFFFDTHALIYSDNAPALEHSLHQEFESRRVNTSNFRKEFFRVSIAEVHEALKRLAPEASFFSDIEAQEYRESLARREATLMPQHQPELLPATI